MQTLSERMVEDMKLAGLAERTRESYRGAVHALVLHCDERSPAQLTAEELRTFLVHLIEEQKPAPSSVRVRLSGIRFFYERTLNCHGELFDLIQPRR